MSDKDHRNDDPLGDALKVGAFMYIAGKHPDVVARAIKMWLGVMIFAVLVGSVIGLALDPDAGEKIAACFLYLVFNVPVFGLAYYIAGRRAAKANVATFSDPVHPERWKQPTMQQVATAFLPLFFAALLPIVILVVLCVGSTSTHQSFDNAGSGAGGDNAGGP